MKHKAQTAFPDDPDFLCDCEGQSSIDVSLAMSSRELAIMMGRQ
jgi:hypothetical protein